MGIFESIKNAFGKSEPAADVTAAPSELLSEAGLDPTGLKFGFGAGSITVSGNIGTESERRKILDVLSGIKGIKSVQDDLVVAAPAPTPRQSPQQPAQPAANPPAATAAGAEGVRTYTVVSGDTLWRIAERMYGNGAHYMKIFEANSGLLKDPDHIFPGQQLVIPEL
jgi:nucleoid-associated protein YgaU